MTEEQQRTSRTRTVTMTVHKIKAELLNVTTPGDDGPRYIHGRIVVSAEGGHDSHSWPLADGEQCWIGDRVTVTITEWEPSRPRSTPLGSPTKDDR